MKDNGQHGYSSKQRVRTTQFIRDLITRFTTKVSAYRYPTSFASSCPIIACIDRTIKIVLDVRDEFKSTTILEILIIRIRKLSLNTFTAIVELSRFNNSCLKSPASTLVDLTFQSRALRSFSLNQLHNLSL